MTHPEGTHSTSEELDQHESRVEQKNRLRVRGMDWARTALLMFVAAVLVIVAMLGYGISWTWFKSTGYLEQNTVSVKPQEPPGAGSVDDAAVPVTGAGVRLSIKGAARELVNPIKPSVASLSRGEQHFNLICTPCHGADGAGHGIMGTVPRLSPASPEEVKDLQLYLRGWLSFTPDINVDFVMDLTDGELFWIITNGGEAIMPGHADALEQDERWDLVNYIKHGLGDQRGL